MDSQNNQTPPKEESQTNINQDAAKKQDENNQLQQNNNQNDKPEFYDPFSDEKPDSNKNENENNKENHNNKDEDVVPEEDKKEINKQVSKALSPMQKELFTIKRENELNNFLNSDEGKHLKAYADEIRKRVLDSRSSGINVKVLAYGVAGKNLLKIGAKMANDSNEQAQRDNVSGNTSRHTEKTTPDFKSMSKHEFEQTVELVKQGRYKMSQ